MNPTFIKFRFEAIATRYQNQQYFQGNHLLQRNATLKTNG